MIKETPDERGHHRARDRGRAGRRGPVDRRAPAPAAPVTEQPPYSILARAAERAVLPIAEQYGLGVLPWSPLAGGWLSGRYRKGDPTHAESSVRLTISRVSWSFSAAQSTSRPE
ncbi:aldo/keto reductase [Streptomyces spiralis]